MASDPHGKYTAAELARLVGVSVRTVRYYVREGLIDPPTGRGRGPHFTDHHLNQLRRVRLLQSTGLDLDTIRQRFAEIRGKGLAAENVWPPEMTAFKPDARWLAPWIKQQLEHEPVHASAVTALEIAPGLTLHVAAPHRVPGPIQLAVLSRVVRAIFMTSGEDNDEEEDDGDQD
jgi:DNA-binding transcriptional MerR regulator